MKSRPRGSNDELVLSSITANSKELGEYGHFVINCLVSNSNKSITSLALIDSGASAFGFVDTKFAQTHNLDFISLRRPRSLKVFDGTESVAGQVSHMVQMDLDIGGHTENILLFVTSLAYFDIVLGLLGCNTITQKSIGLKEIKVLAIKAVTII